MNEQERIERRSKLTFSLPTHDPEAEFHVRHDGTAYLLAYYEPSQDQPELTDEYLNMKYGVEVKSIEVLMHYTWHVVDWPAVDKGDIRALAQASGLRVDDIHPVLAASLEDEGFKKIQSAKRSEKRFGFGRSLRG